MIISIVLRVKEIDSDDNIDITKILRMSDSRLMSIVKNGYNLQR